MCFPINFETDTVVFVSKSVSAQMQIRAPHISIARKTTTAVFVCSNVDPRGHPYIAAGKCFASILNEFWCVATRADGGQTIDYRYFKSDERGWRRG